MTSIRLIIPGEPVAKGRARATTVHGHARLYTPKTTKDAERVVAQEAARIYQGAPMTGPIMMRIEAFFAVRPSWSKKKHAAMLGQPHTQKPDWDNLGKLYCDALNGIIYKDDSQISDALTVKKWSGISRVEITITPFEFGVFGEGQSLVEIPVRGVVLP